MNKEQSLFDRQNEDGWNEKLLEAIETNLRDLVKMNLEKQEEQANENGLFPEETEHIERDDKIYEISFDSAEDEDTHELNI